MYASPLYLEPMPVHFLFDLFKWNKCLFIALHAAVIYLLVCFTFLFQLSFAFISKTCTWLILRQLLVIRILLIITRKLCKWRSWCYSIKENSNVEWMKSAIQFKDTLQRRRAGIVVVCLLISIFFFCLLGGRLRWKILWFILVTCPPLRSIRPDATPR